MQSAGQYSQVCLGFSILPIGLFIFRFVFISFLLPFFLHFQINHFPSFFLFCFVMNLEVWQSMSTLEMYKQTIHYLSFGGNHVNCKSSTLRNWTTNLSCLRQFSVFLHQVFPKTV